MSQIRIDAQIRCPFCHDSILTGPRAGCAECLAWHHRACLQEHGSCSSCGAATPQSSRQATHQDVSEVLALICQSQGCFSLETLDQPGRRICANHARSELAGLTFAGVCMLVLGIAGVFLMVGLIFSNEQGPWPLLALPVTAMVAFGVLAIWHYPRGKAAIEAALPGAHTSELASPILRSRGRDLSKVSS